METVCQSYTCCRLLHEGRGLLETTSVSGKTPSIKASAAEAVAVMAFVGSEHPGDTLEVVQHLQSLWKGNVLDFRLSIDTTHRPLLVPCGCRKWYTGSVSSMNSAQWLT